MPPGTREPPLKEGDRVTIAVRHFGEEYARTRGGRQWASDSVRDEGIVQGKQAGKFLVDFDDGEEARWWARRLLRFASRSLGSKRRLTPVHIVEPGPLSIVQPA